MNKLYLATLTLLTVSTHSIVYASGYPYPVTVMNKTWFATPISGNTNFNSLYSGSFVDLTGTQSAGGAGLLAANVAGYNFRLLASSNAVDCGIGIEPFTGQTAVVYGFTNNGLTNLVAFEASSNDPKIFDLQSVDITVDGLSTGNGARNVRLFGYRNGNPVAGALLTQAVTPASAGGLLVSFNVSGNSNFVGIDKLRIETDGSYTISGAIGIDNLNAINFRDFTLPVSLTRFEANAGDNNSVELNWQTAEETNNSHFIIERGKDGQRFLSIGRVQGRENYIGITNYHFTDFTPDAGINYYRLKQVDIDGRGKYHGLRTVTISASELKIYPNPIHQGYFIADLGQKVNEKIPYRLIGVNGTVVQSGMITTQKQPISVTGIVKGIYLFEVGKRQPVKVEIR
jgi:hypothetical protein